MRIVQSEEQMSRDYCSRLGQYCPVCGANMDVNGSYGDREIEAGIVFEQCHCTNCGSTWTAKYELYEIDEIDLGPGYTWDDGEEDPNDRVERPDWTAQVCLSR